MQLWFLLRHQFVRPLNTSSRPCAAVGLSAPTTINTEISLLSQLESRRWPSNMAVTKAMLKSLLRSKWMQSTYSKLAMDRGRGSPSYRRDAPYVNLRCYSAGPIPSYVLSKYHDFLAVFALAHSKINQIAQFLNEIIQEVSD